MDLLEINHRAIRVIKQIRILDQISWPPQIEKEFFLGLSQRKHKKLNFAYKKVDYKDKKAELKRLLPALSTSDPLHVFTTSTIQSYLNAMEMVENVGTSTFQDLSIAEYGQPRHLLFGSKYSHLKTAEQFLAAFHDYDHPYIKNEAQIHSSKELKEFLTREAEKTLGEDAPKVILSKLLTSKAAAGRQKVRIRQNATFSTVDLKNLLVHEIFTHTLTAINGSQQNGLPLLAYGAPRTTKTQEGLATFSEVITGLLDLDRLKRISLRVLAIDMALEGADLYDLFYFFKDKGQSERESYLSASRILRGGPPSGGIVFTKDGVYLEGLIRVHSFFRWAFKTNNLDLVHMLFIGRLDINDIFMLSEAYEQGRINHPKYLPDWYQHTDLLAGKMAFSLILNNIDLKNVEEHFNKKNK